MDNLKCIFCGQEAASRLVLTSEKVLQQVYLSFPYNGRRHHTCEACADYWDARFREINKKYSADVDELFRLMKAHKGGPKEI